MAYTFEVFSQQYPVVVFFVQHLGYYRGLQDTTAGLMDHRAFWTSTTNGHLKLATLAWCNIFGSRAEDLHWTKTPNGAIGRICAGIYGYASHLFRQQVVWP